MSRPSPHDAAPPQRRRIGYGPHPQQFVDVLKGAKASRCVLLVHGGFWRAEKDSESLWPARSALAGHALVVGTVEYRTADAGGSWPRCHDDVVAAVRAVWSSTGIRPDQTVLVGHSAGGHLVLTAAAELPGLGAVVAAAAVTDLVAAREDRLGDDAVSVLFGGRQVPTEQLQAASPLHRPPLSCRVELVHGSDDQAVPTTYSQRLAEHWNGVADVKLSVIEGARHMHLVNPQRPAWATVAQRITAALGAEAA